MLQCLGGTADRAELAKLQVSATQFIFCLVLVHQLPWAERYQYSGQVLWVYTTPQLLLFEVELVQFSQRDFPNSVTILEVKSKILFICRGNRQVFIFGF